MPKKGKKRREAERRKSEREAAVQAESAPEVEAARLARAKAKAEHEAERLRRKVKREHAGEGINPLLVALPVALVAAIGIGAYLLLSGGGGDSTPTPTPHDTRLGGVTPAPGASLQIEARGEEEGSTFVPDALTITAGQVTEIVVTNTAERVSHNLRVSGDDGLYETEQLNLPKDDWFLPLVEKGEQGILWLKMDTPGTYKFQCDFHPQTQKGNLIVQ